MPGLMCGLAIGYAFNMLSSPSETSETSSTKEAEDARKYRALVSEYDALHRSKYPAHYGPAEPGTKGTLSLVAHYPYSVCGYIVNPQTYRDKSVGFCWRCGTEHAGGQLLPYELI